MASDLKDVDLSESISALMDFSFKTFVTISLVKIMYIVGLVFIGLTSLGIFFNGLRGGGDGIIVGAIMAPITFALGVLWLRVSLEMVVVIFRIAQNTTVLAKAAKGEPLTEDLGDVVPPAPPADDQPTGGPPA